MKFFTNPEVISHVRRAVLAAFFDRFTHSFPNNFALPAPRLDNESYPFLLAEVLERSCELPPELLQALLAVESLFATVTPEDPPDPSTDPEASAARLQHAIQLWLRQNPPPPQGPCAAPPCQPPITETPDKPSPPNTPLSPIPIAHSKAPGRAVVLPPIEPWPEPVDAQELLGGVLARFTHYLVLPPGAAVALTLWAAHAHAFAAFLLSPRLNLSSLQPGCGKTTTLDLLASLVPRPLRTENLTAPVLFRLVDQFHPTLLLDEVDTYLTAAEELRGLLNAGHKRGACAYRCEGENNSVRAFKAFTPAVLAGIGSLPDTLLDRSISVLLVPAKPGALTAHFDQRHTEIETTLTRKLTRWTRDNSAALQACDPPLPATAFNRLADNWRPLFAIAQVAGGVWPGLALDAFKHLTTQVWSHAERRSYWGARSHALLGCCRCLSSSPENIYEFPAQMAAFTPSPDSPFGSDTFP
jgi:hypothetical protein